MIQRYLLICFLILFYSIPVIAAKKKITLVASEFPPYYGEKLPNHGFVAEIAKEAFKKVDYKLVIVFVPFARAIKDAKRGMADGILGIWYSREREQWFVFSNHLTPNLMGFYKRKDRNISFKTYADLKSYRIGTVLGYANPPGFDEAGLLTESRVSEAQNMLKLMHKRIDLALMDKSVGLHTMKEHSEYIDALEWLEPPIKVSYLYIGFSKKATNYEVYSKAFNLGFIRLIEEGGVKRIKDKHGY